MLVSPTAPKEGTKDFCGNHYYDGGPMHVQVYVRCGAYMRLQVFSVT